MNTEPIEPLEPINERFERVDDKIKERTAEIVNDVMTRIEELEIDQNTEVAKQELSENIMGFLHSLEYGGKPGNWGLAYVSKVFKALLSKVAQEFGIDPSKIIQDIEIRMDTYSSPLGAHIADWNRPANDLIVKMNDKEYVLAHRDLETSSGGFEEQPELESFTSDFIDSLK